VQRSWNTGYTSRSQYHAVHLYYIMATLMNVSGAK
jgi:hypothetical protein